MENRTGAGGTIGTGFVAKADPDGYTMLVHSNAHTISPSLYSNLSYHPARDFAAVIPLGHDAERHGRSAGEGLEDSRRSRRRSQSQAGRVELLVGRCRERNPSERGTVPAQRGRGGRACSVQGRCGSNDRSDCRTDRLLLRAGRAGPAARSGGQARCARGERRQTRRCAAGRADHPGSRFCRRRVSESGSESSCRRRRRAMSSTSFTARRSKRCRRPRCGTSWPHWASTRWS